MGIQPPQTILIPSRRQVSIVVERKKKKVGSRFKFSWIQISVTSWLYDPGHTQTPSVSFFIYEMGITHSYQEHKMTVNYTRYQESF